VATTRRSNRVGEHLESRSYPNFNTSLASAMPAAGRPYSLAVTRASATSCRQRKAGRVAVNSSVTVR